MPTTINQKGSALYFSLIVLSILLAVIFGVSTIIVVQLKTISEAGQSVISLYAADTGIEKALYDRKFVVFPTEIPPSSSEVLSNGAQYQTTIYQAGDPECPTTTAYWFCVESMGKFKDIKRGLRVDL